MPDFGLRRIGYVHEFQATIEDAAGAPVDLTGATLAASLRAYDGGPAVATIAASSSDPVGGVVDFALAPGDTAGLAPGLYLVGLDITDGQGRTIDGTGGERWTITFVGGGDTNPAPSAAFTVAKAERRLVGRRRGWMTPWGMDVSTTGGNADVQLALLDAMDWLGATTADPGAVADDDLAILPASSRAALLDVADLKMMEMVLGRWDEVTSSDGNRRKESTSFAVEVQKAIDRKLMELRSRYGYGLAAPSLGSIDLGFVQSDSSGEF